MYLTGDLAKIEPGGPVYCLGRADTQVKIRGFRVELEEINAALAAQPGVAAAAALVRPLGETEEFVAFVVPANAPIETSVSARHWPASYGPAHLKSPPCRACPAYMVLGVILRCVRPPCHACLQGEEVRSVRNASRDTFRLRSLESLSPRERPVRGTTDG